MPTPAGVFYDGDFTVASPASGLERSNPFAWQPFTEIFSQKFMQLQANFKALAMGTSPSAGGMTPAVTFNGNIKNGPGPYLVEETPRADSGAGIVEWNRIWAHVPATIYEFPGMDTQRQKYSCSTVPWNGVYDTWGNFHGTFRSFTAIEEWTEPLTGIVERKFLRVDDTKKPLDMLRRFAPLIPYRIIKFNDERGKEHLFELGKQGIAEPTQINRWRGDIWEIRNVYIQPPNYGTVLASAGFTAFGLPPTMTVDGNGNAIGYTGATLGSGGIGGIGGDFA